MKVNKTTRRSFLAALAASVPALVSLPVRAGTSGVVRDAGLAEVTGIWQTLNHVTDGTDPRTTIIAPPNFTAEIRKLEGSEIALTGFLQPIASGFGKSKQYLLSVNTFHCPYCYGSGRGTLVLASIEGHLPTSPKKVAVRGVLALQEKDPTDFYFQLKNAKLVA